MPPAAAKGAFGQMIHVAEFGRTASGTGIDSTVEYEAQSYAMAHKHNGSRPAISLAVHAEEGLGDHVGIVGNAARYIQKPLERRHNRNITGMKRRAPRNFSGNRVGNTLHRNTDTFDRAQRNSKFFGIAF